MFESQMVGCSTLVDRQQRMHGHGQLEHIAEEEDFTQTARVTVWKRISFMSEVMQSWPYEEIKQRK